MSKGTIVRIVALILALINQQLAKHGISPIPADDQTISDIIVWIIGAYTAYKDNPVTREGKQANAELKKLKAEKKLKNSVDVQSIDEQEVQQNKDSFGGGV